MSQKELLIKYLQKSYFEYWSQKINRGWFVGEENSKIAKPQVEDEDIIDLVVNYFSLIETFISWVVTLNDLSHLAEKKSDEKALKYFISNISNYNEKNLIPKGV